MFNPKEVNVSLQNKTITLQTGKLARQANGAIFAQCGGTQVLVTACCSSSPREGANFLPLTVDYAEKTAAAGKIPGGYFKREGRPREEETLTSRIIDRSLRPLFPDGWRHDTQVIATVMSSEIENPADTLALIGAAAAIEISDMPFAGPLSGVRVCRVDGEWLVNPSFEQRDVLSDINIFLSCTQDAIIMVEGGAKEASESELIDALLFGHEQSRKIIEAVSKLRGEAGKEKRIAPEVSFEESLYARVKELSLPKIQAAYSIKEKLPRYAALDEMKAQTKAALFEADPSAAERSDEVSEILGDIKYRYVREEIVEKGARIDGRGLTDVRPIECEAGVLDRTHGSALFTRGETQALVTMTLGTKRDEQHIDALHEDISRRFMLHYNFPPYSVGEARPLRSAGRRELGHGALAHRALEPLLDLEGNEDFPYTLRIVGEILESNGSSSMATVCGGSLAAFDAGVPMKKACAGIAMGLIKEGDKIAILSDILGDEDHLGDMDFKVAGTEDGVTAIQMDIKIDGVTRDILEKALEQARQGRLHILGEMQKALQEPRDDLSMHAPRITTLQINTDKIRDVIGPGGKVIRDITARSGAAIDIEDDGTIRVAASNGESGDMALKMIKELTQEAELNKLYLGHVRKIADFGAFVQLFPGTDGLIHISELAEKRVAKVEDVLQEGDEVMVKVIGIEKGKIRLSRKAAIIEERERLAKAEAAQEAPAPAEV